MLFRRKCSERGCMMYWSTVFRGDRTIKISVETGMGGRSMELPLLATNDSLRRWSSPVSPARASWRYTPSNLTRVRSRHYSASSPCKRLASLEIGRRTEHLSDVSASLYRSPIFAYIFVCVFPWSNLMARCQSTWEHNRK